VKRRLLLLMMLLKHLLLLLMLLEVLLLLMMVWLHLRLLLQLLHVLSVAIPHHGIALQHLLGRLHTSSRLGVLGDNHTQVGLFGRGARLVHTQCGGGRRRGRRALPLLLLLLLLLLVFNSGRCCSIRSRSRCLLLL